MPETEQPKWVREHYVLANGAVVGSATPSGGVWDARVGLMPRGEWITRKAARKAVEEYYAFLHPTA